MVQGTMGWTVGPTRSPQSCASVHWGWETSTRFICSQLPYPLNPLFLSLLVSRGSPTSSSCFPHSRLSMWDPKKMAFASQLDITLYHCQICPPSKFGVWDMHMARLCLDSESYRGVLRDLPPTSKRERLPWLHCRLLTQCPSIGFKVKHDPKLILGDLWHLRQEANTSGLAFLGA